PQSRRGPARVRPTGGGAGASSESAGGRRLAFGQGSGRFPCSDGRHIGQDGPPGGGKCADGGGRPAQSGSLRSLRAKSMREPLLLQRRLPIWDLKKAAYAYRRRTFFGHCTGRDSSALKFSRLGDSEGGGASSAGLALERGSSAGLARERSSSPVGEGKLCD